MTNESGTLSDEFDSAYESFQELLDEKGGYATDRGKSTGMEALQSTLEGLTRSVSSVDMFSTNESYEEMDPKTLKFLLLPYFLGMLWQQKRNLERKSIWAVVETYLRDFLDRLVDGGIITSRPHIVKLLEEYQTRTESGEDCDDTGSTTVPSVLSGNDYRQQKIARFKQTKELEGKIRILSERKKEDNADPELIRELYLNLLRKFSFEAEAELESILAEKKLVSSYPGPSELPPRSSNSKSSLPYETFIITKSDIQKKTFGLGYPSIPVMTVEELYRDRVAKGIWAKPTTLDDSHVTQDDDESRQIQEELLEEGEDEGRRAQLQAMDEYKDMHRRGWGNRMNRS